jgi:NADH dehydrogenase FAD-containing subunit
MGPGLLAGIYRPQEVRFNIRKMAEDRGASFIRDVVVKIDPEGRILSLRSGMNVRYDVVSFNTGSEVVQESISLRNGSVYTVKPIENLLKARREILGLLNDRELRLVVIGGGAAGTEISANLWRLVHDNGGKAGITLIAGMRLLDQVPGKARDIASKSLSRRGIAIMEGVRAEKIENHAVHLTDGGTVSYDLAFLTTGIRPSGLFRESGLPTGKDSGLLVNAYLQSVAYPEIFGGGDCIAFQKPDLEKVGVYAVRENKMLFRNLHAALSGGRLEKFDPGGKYLLILNLGDDRGVLWKKGCVLSGKPVFILKDRIDRRFMRKFQVSGEHAEPAD